MSYITIFTAPKPFSNPHNTTIQCNAISSWKALGPEVEVLLMGDEDGMAEAAKELGVRQVADVKRSLIEGKYGPPYINAMYDAARQLTDSPMLVCSNADIIFFPDLISATRQAETLAPEFLMFGQRWDLDIRQSIDFTRDWIADLRKNIQEKGKRHSPIGSDYFICPRDCFTDIPEFTIGRSGWDNWMIYHAIQLGMPAIDASPSITIIHQNHDYSHLPGGKPPYHLPETERNLALAGGRYHRYFILDTDVQLVNGELRKPRRSLLRSIRALEVALYPRQGDPRGLRLYLVNNLVRLRQRIQRTVN